MKKCVSNALNSEFKKVSDRSNNFFTIYDRFINERKADRTDQANSPTTIKRYEYKH